METEGSRGPRGTVRVRDWGTSDKRGWVGARAGSRAIIFKYALYASTRCGTRYLCHVVYLSQMMAAQATLAAGPRSCPRNQWKRATWNHNPAKVAPPGIATAWVDHHKKRIRFPNPPRPAFAIPPCPWHTQTQTSVLSTLRRFIVPSYRLSRRKPTHFSLPSMRCIVAAVAPRLVTAVNLLHE